MGAPRTLQLSRYRGILLPLLRVGVISSLSGLAVAIFGVGLSVLLNTFSPDLVGPQSTSYIIYGIIAISTWVTMVSLNHLSEVVTLLGNLDYYEYIYMIPAYIMVVAIGPAYDLALWAIHLVMGWGGVTFNNLSVVREIISFATATIPDFTLHIIHYLVNLISAPTQNAILNLGHVLRDFAAYVGVSIWAYFLASYEVIRDVLAQGIVAILPHWLQDTRIGGWLASYLSGAAITAFIINWIIRWLFGW